MAYSWQTKTYSTEKAIYSSTTSTVSISSTNVVRRTSITRSGDHQPFIRGDIGRATISSPSIEPLRRPSLRSQDFPPFIRGDIGRTNISNPIEPSRRPSLRSEDPQPFIRDFKRATVTPVLRKDAAVYQEPSDQPAPQKSSVNNGPVYVFCNPIKDPNKNIVHNYEKDLELLKKAFKKFDMNVILKKDKTKAKIQSRIKAISKENFEKSACLVVVILSEGKRREEIAAKDDVYSFHEDIVLPILKNPTLRGKPKIFIVQASRGDWHIGSVDRTDGVSLGGSPGDVITLYSSFEGFKSYFNDKGSFLIQEFAKILEEAGDQIGVADIFDHVIKEVKYNSGGKQIPVVSTNLEQKYVFGNHK